MGWETSLFRICDFGHHISGTGISCLKQTFYICNVIIAADNMQILADYRAVMK